MHQSVCVGMVPNDFYLDYNHLQVHKSYSLFQKQKLQFKNPYYSLFQKSIVSYFHL